MITANPINLINENSSKILGYRYLVKINPSTMINTSAITASNVYHEAQEYNEGDIFSDDGSTDIEGH